MLIIIYEYGTFLGKKNKTNKAFSFLLKSWIYLFCLKCNDVWSKTSYHDDQ